MDLSNLWVTINNWASHTWPATVIIVTVATLIVAYQTVMKSLSAPTPKRDPGEAAALQHEFELFDKRLNRIEAYSVDRPNLTSEQKSAVTEQVMERLYATGVTASADAVRRKIEQDVANIQNASIMRELCSKMLKRLVQEVESLNRKVNNNLALGFLLSISGILVLAFAALQSTSDHITDKAVFLYEFMPKFSLRLSLAVFTEVFAYFFLRLYRTGIGEIRHMQNEITSIELRVISLEVAIANNASKTIEKICAEFLTTERNFMLKKGDRTIGMAMEEVSLRADRNVPEIVARLLHELPGKVRHGVRVRRKSSKSSE